jgi:hypothetical protein
LRRRALGFPPRQSQKPCCLVRATRTFDPGRLQLARHSALRPSKAKLRSLDVHACLASTPFRSTRPNPSSSGWELPRRPTLPLSSACLAAHRSEPGKMCLTSLCNRSTTRAPTDRSIPGRTAFAELTAHRADTCSERPRGVLHPCGNRTPGGCALDGALPALAKPTTACPKGKAEHRTGRCHLTAAFSTACKVVRFGL